MSDDGFRLADRAGDEPAQVLRRAFVATVALVFILGLPLGTTAAVIGTVLVVLALAVELLLPRERRLGRWQGLAAGRAGAADSGYAAVYQALREREAPADVRPHRVRTPTGVRNELTLRAGAERVQVVVFPSGKDLAFGWTMWHREIPAVTVWHWLQGALAGHEPVDDTPARVLAAAVHAAMLEGVVAAESEREISLAEAFGRDVPVEDHDASAAAFASGGGPAAAGERAGFDDRTAVADRGATPAEQAAPGGRVHGSALARLRGLGGRVQKQQPARTGGRHAGDRLSALAGRPARPPAAPSMAAPPGGPPTGAPVGPLADATVRVPPVGGAPEPGGPQGEPVDRRPPLVPGLGDMEERTAVISPLQFRPYEFTVAMPVEVFTPDGAVVGRLEPGTRYWAVDEHPGGLVVQIAAGAALLRNRSAVRPE